MQSSVKRPLLIVQIFGDSSPKNSTFEKYMFIVLIHHVFNNSSYLLAHKLTMVN